MPVRQRCGPCLVHPCNPRTPTRCARHGSLSPACRHAEYTQVSIRSGGLTFAQDMDVFPSREDLDLCIHLNLKTRHPSSSNDTHRDTRNVVLLKQSKRLFPALFGSSRTGEISDYWNVPLILQWDRVRRACLFRSISIWRFRRRPEAQVRPQGLGVPYTITVLDIISLASKDAVFSVFLLSVNDL